MSPRPQRISRLDVLAAARDLVDRNGVDHLTMRRLGSALGADPMTAYRHFAGKADITAALADGFWEELRLPAVSAHSDWRSYAVALMRSIRADLAAHTGLIPIVATHPIGSPAALRVADDAVGALLELGAPLDPTLGDLVNVLVMVTVASAMGEFSVPAGSETSAGSENESGHQGGAASDADAQDAPAQDAGAQDAASATPATPHLGRVIAAGWTPSAERQFESGLAAILHGWRFTAPPA